MVAKHRVKRVKRVKRTRKQSKHVRRGRKTYTRHNRRTGGALYNPYTGATTEPIYDTDYDFDTTPPPLPPRSLELARKELAEIEGRKTKPYDSFWDPIIKQLKEEIENFEKLKN